jgi:fatty-acyl-CoA synthase
MGMTADGLSYWQAQSEGIELLDMTIGDFLDRRADELPTQEAIVYSCYPEFGDAFNIRWAYQEYRERANAVAKGLLALGLQKGDHIAVWAANVPEWLLLEMAAAKAGLVLVTINPLLQKAEVEYILKQGDVQALFFMARVRSYDHLATVRSLVAPGTRHGEVSSESLPLLRYVSLISMPPAGLLEQDGWRPALFSEVVVAGTQVSDAELAKRQATVTPLDPAMIMYTSGTTGSPKGAVLTHRGLLNNARFMAHCERVKQTDRYCTPMPFFHVGGCVCGILIALAAGCTLHPLIAFDALKLLQINSGEHCTISGGVPTMLLAMLQHPNFDQYDLSSLKMILSGGASIPVALMEQAHERIGADPWIVYAQTEASCSMTQTLPDDLFELKASTCGVPLPHTEVKIVDPATGQTVPCGERGEICTRGYLVMAGYYKMPEKTAETVDRDGWLHTGDLATMDVSGHVNIVGRVKDMVIRGGENLFPTEIEEFLIRHPKVADVQVVGVPDAFFGEELLALVMPMSGEALTEQELRDYCKGQVSHQKIPRYIQFVDSYPMTASGKVQKFVLRERAIKELGLEEIAKTRMA